jgi:hypothetical protein
VDSDELIDQMDEWQRERRSLCDQNDALEQDPQRLHKMLQAIDAGLEVCVTDAVFAAGRSEAQQEVLRAIRSRAAVMALHCMAIMQLCACAVLPSTLLRAHVAALRPREAGKKDPAADAVVPSICRVYIGSLPLRLGLVVLWLIGNTCHALVIFDRFEHDSAQQWLACAASSLMLPVIVCISASLNTKTVWGLLKEFETLYVIAYVLGMVILYLFLFRERPAKMVAFALMGPSFMQAGFLDAYVEGGRLLNSRIFFVCNVAALLLNLALILLKLGMYTDYSFKVGTFSFVASSIACDSFLTLLVFGVKNIALSFHEPGSLVVFKSAVVCVFLDADALAVLKGSYSLLGEVLGKYMPNETIEKYLKRQRLSIVEFSRTANGRTHVNIVPPLVPTLHPGASLLVPAPTAGPEMETPQADLSELGSAAHLVEEYRDIGADI